MAALSPFAFSVLSVEQAMDRDHRRSGHGGDPSLARCGRHHRSTRRVTSNHNSFQTMCSPDFNEPPPYTTAVRQRPVAHPRHAERERLPKYECTVSMEAKVLLNLESINPLHSVSQSDWREVYVDICGTLLSIYRSKDSAKGRLLRSYTLQHAEVGLAPDVSHTVYHPNTRLAHLIPSPARAKAYKKDARLFDVHKQHILRLRVESDQMLFAQQSKDTIYDLIHCFSAAIDISPPIDDRSATRQCTIPRRRRRDRADLNTAGGDITDPAFIAEQERILRTMYPSLVGDQQGPQDTREESETVHTTEQQHDGLQAIDEDEIDVNEIREEGAPRNSARPAFSRTSSSTSQELLLAADSVHSSDPANFTQDGKWRPMHTRTQAQVIRYAQRCMPILLAEAVRASDVLIYSGRRVKINWRTDTLDDWELKPPSYRSHHFKRLQHMALERSSSSASTITDQQASDSQAGTDQITPLESTSLNGELSKVISPLSLTDKAAAQLRQRDALHKAHSNDPNSINAFSGVVYCF